MKLFICPLPPPVHGQANVSQDTVNLFEKKIVLDTNYENMNTSKKVFSFFIYFFKFWHCILKYNICTIYFTPSRSILGSLRDIPVLLVGYFSQKKMIAHIHGGDFESFINGLDTVVRKLLIKLYSECTYLVFPMKQIAEDTETTLELKNTITISNYLKSPNIYEADFNSGKCIQLLFLSNILRTKGINEFLDLVEKIHKSDISLEAKVAGSFMREDQQVRIRVLKSQEKGLIDYLGFIEKDEKIQELAKCDFFIFPSYSESFGIVLIEAMASGCIIITSDNKYHKYLINEEYGRTFDFQKNLEGVQNYISKLKDKPNKMLKMKKAAMQEAKKYGFDSYKKQMIYLFNES